MNDYDQELQRQKSIVAIMSRRISELEDKLDESRKLGLYWQDEAERLMEIIEDEDQTEVTGNGIL